MEKGLRSKFWTIVFLTLIWVIADNVLEFVFPTHLESIGKSYLLIGLFLSLPAIIGLAIDLPLGNLSDTWSRKKLMIIGLVLSPIFAIMIFIFKSNLLLLLLFLLWGLGFQIWTVPRSAYFARLTAREKRSQQYGTDIQFFYIGETVGPLIAGVLLSSLGEISNVAFYVSMCLIAALLIALLVKDGKDHGGPFSRKLWRSEKSVAKDLRLLKSSAGGYVYSLLGITVLFTSLAGAVYALEPLFYSSYKLSPVVGGIILASFYLPAIFLGAPFGKLADRYGKKPMLLAGLLIAGISLVAFGLSTNMLMLIAFAALNSVGIILSRPALSGLVVDLAYKHRKGEFAGIWSLFSDLGFVIGPILAGVLAQFSSIGGAFIVFGGITLLLAAVLALVRKRPYEFL